MTTLEDREPPVTSRDVDRAAVLDAAYDAALKAARDAYDAALDALDEKEA